MKRMRRSTLALCIGAMLAAGGATAFAQQGMGGMGMGGMGMGGMSGMGGGGGPGGWVCTQWSFIPGHMAGQMGMGGMGMGGMGMGGMQGMQGMPGMGGMGGMGMGGMAGAGTPGGWICTQWSFMVGYGTGPVREPEAVTQQRQYVPQTMDEQAGMGGMMGGMSGQTYKPPK